MILFRFFLVTLFLTGSGFITAQKIKIAINSAPEKAVLLSVEGEELWEIDSVKSQNGIFSFSLNGKHNGFYALKFDESHKINFVYESENVLIKTDYNHLIDSLKVIHSSSNKLYYDFLNLNKSYKSKSELLLLVLSRYPEKDDYYEATKKKLKQIQNNYLTFVKITSQTNPASFIARYIRSAQSPVIDGSLSNEKQLKYLKAHSLDNVDFNDADLIESDLFTNKSIEYLTYYHNQNLPKALLEKKFTKAVDSLLNKAKINEAVYQHIAEYLIKGFTQFGFETIVNYIVNNYVIKDDLCVDVNGNSTIQKRIDQVKYLENGTIAPNIIIEDPNGDKIDLSKIESEIIIVMFYASWCPHCQTAIPELVELYNSQKSKRVEVLAISIDKDKNEWRNFISENKMNWLNGCDSKGWDGKAAADYYLYATPSFFILDEEKRIIAKPTTIEEVIPFFKN